MRHLVKGLMSHLGELALLAGAAAVAVGAGMLSLPAGFITGGALMIVGGVLSIWGGGADESEEGRGPDGPALRPAEQGHGRRDRHPHRLLTGGLAHR